MEKAFAMTVSQVIVTSRKPWHPPCPTQGVHCDDVDDSIWVTTDQIIESGSWTFVHVRPTAGHSVIIPIDADEHRQLAAFADCGSSWLPTLIPELAASFALPAQTVDKWNCSTPVLYRWPRARLIAQVNFARTCMDRPYRSGSNVPILTIGPHQ